MSTVYREQEWDTVSRRDGPKSFTTVRRYKVPDRTQDRGWEEDRYEEDQLRIIRREREPREVRETDYVVEREVERDREPVREYRYVHRDVERSPSPARSVHDTYVIEREYEREREREPARSPYSLEKYSKSTEYFSRPEPAQPIIIRSERVQPQPIIIQEAAPQQQQIIVRREEPQYEIVERTEVEERPVVRREPRREEEDYYYERRVKEVDRGRGRDDLYEDEREWSRDRYDEGRYSDDDAVYIRRTRTEDCGRDVSPNHKKHLTEGALVGVGAAELLRHHRKHEGEDPGHHARQVVGYGALGAVGAEAISRIKGHYGRERSRSTSREGRRRHKSRHRGRSRSQSLSKTQTLAGLAAIAGVGALAYAAGRGGTKNQTTVIEETPSRRSRSRRRRHSVSVLSRESRSRSRPQSKHRDPEHRNRKIAQAGLAGAAAMGIAEKIRSRSRSRKGEKSRSRSRIRTGVPIAAAGLGSAAVAGLYERAKARKEAKEDRRRSRSRSYSRSRSRSRSVPVSGSRHAAASDTALVEYGGDPIIPDPAASRRHHRRSRSRDYDPADYRGRRRGSSASSTDSRNCHGSRSRSRSRARGLAEAAAVAGVAGVAAHEAAKRRERKRAERDRLEQAEGGTISPSASPPPSSAGYSSGYQSGRYYPETNEFPPPPVAPYEPPPANFIQGQPMPGQPTPYNPAEWGPPQPNPVYQQPPHFDPPPREAANPYAPPNDGRYRPGGGDHVSAPFAPGHSSSDGLRTPTAGSPVPAEPQPTKSVQFDLDSEDGSPDRSRHSKNRHDSDSRDHDEHGDRGRKNTRDDHHHDKRDDSISSWSSGETVELPPRFDELGRPRDVDPLADRLEDFLNGGTAGRMFQRLFR